MQPSLTTMKHILLAASVFLFAGNAFSQRVIDTINMEPGYAKQVFYQIQTGSKHSSGMTQWHIAHTTLQMDNAIRLNHAAGVFAYLYPKGDNSSYNNFDTTGWKTWNMPYNDMKDEALGALNKQKNLGNQWDFSWGVYDPTSHVVKGDSLYLIKVGSGANTKLYKFMPIKQDKNGDFIFEFGPLDAQSGSPDTIKQSQADKGTFKYYNFNLDRQVAIEAAGGNWHLNFARYYDLVPAPGTNDSGMYPVSGVESKRGLKIALVNGVTFDDIIAAPQAFIDIANADTSIAAGHGFKVGLTRVGSDWRFFNGSSFVVVPRKNYIAAITNATGTEYWALRFLSFSGQSTGRLTLERTKLGELAAVNSLDANTLSVFPNPASDLLWVRANTSTIQQITLYSLTGTVVNRFTCNDNLVSIPIENLPQGQYIVEAQHSTGSQRSMFIKH